MKKSGHIFAADNIFATDIAISKAAGLIYVTAGMSVYVIDAKDPYHPIILNVIIQAPDAEGTMSPLGYSPAVAEKDGWLYLANNQKGLRVLDLDPVYLKFYCGDGEFSVSRTFCTDYYPALTEGNGWKEIILLGYDANYGLLNAPGKVKLTGVMPTSTKVKPAGGAACEDSAISDGTCRATFTEGVAKFYVKNEPGLDPAQNPYVTLNFEIDFSGYAWWQNLLHMSPLNMLTKKATVRLRVRNNSNVTFGEVLNGEAVFVGDVDAKGKGSIGLSDVNLLVDAPKRLSFVQELFNQVVSRKRNFRAADGKLTKTNNYAMIIENGVFGQTTVNAVKMFRNEFGAALGLNADGERIGNTRVEFEVQPDGTIKYHDTNTSTNPAAPNNDNTTDMFRKLMKDYGLRASTAASEPWLHKIIDRATLAGAKERIPANWLTEQLFAKDVQPNYQDTSERKDTGLYELYKNVVVQYVDEVIKEAERYAGKKDSVFDDVPTSNWYSRDGKGPAEDPLRPGYSSRGMSYSYGGKMRLEDFNDIVVSAPYCNAPETGRQKIVVFDNNLNLFNRIEIATPAVIAVGPDSNPAVDMSYAGNLNSSCEIGDGPTYKFRYAGLRKHEKTASESHQMWVTIDPLTSEPIFIDPPEQTKILGQYNSEYWAGIDCSGLVQRSITRAENLHIPGATSKVKDLGSLGSCSLNDDDCKPCGDPIWSQSYMPTYARSLGNYAGIQRTEVLKRARKGDVIIYSGHISLVHSDRASCVGTDCQYEIIHASGSDCLDINRNGRCENNEPFNRKVVVNNTQLFRANPTGFGRIKLWD